MTAILDGLLVCALPVLAWRALTTNDLHEAVVLFIAVGLLSALAWARLDAPDIALVEAAVGAGVTGALLITTLRVLGPQPRAPARRVSRIGLAGLAVASSLGIGGALAMMPAPAVGPGEDVRAWLPKSGVHHPVTAVLLDLRSYDTLLEVAVLIVAVLAARSWTPRVLSRGPDREGAPTRSAAERGPRGDDPTRPLVAVLVRLLVPGIVLVAGYLLWRGTKAPGGAFQAAAVLAGGGILAILAGAIRPPDLQSVWVRRLLALGPGVFLTIGAVPLAAGTHLLEYPSGWAGHLILTIELALTCSIALVLVLFLPGMTTRSRDASEDRP